VKAVLQYRASPGFETQLRAAAPEWLDIVVVPELDMATFAREMVDTNILLHALEPVTQAVIENAAQLKLIQKIGVGVNTIDLEAAAARGVAVANMPGTNSQAVAEMSLMLMLASLRRVSYFDPATRAGRGWVPRITVFDSVGEIGGRTVGLVGYGAVARVLAPVLLALGAKVIYTATSPKADAAGTWCTFEAILAQADLVSLHLPLTAATEKMLNRDALALMKPGSVLINTSRGGLVDEAALIDALKSGHLAGAGLDVFATEPVSQDNPLLTLDNVIVMPHIAWLTPETLDRSITVVIENCRRVRAGEPLLHQVT
jgi:phosphoglycerate dehydrogenase-like enzyme